MLAKIGPAAWIMLLIAPCAFGADVKPAPVAAPAARVTSGAPYTWIGRLVQNGEQQVLFTDGERLISAKRGETIDGSYLVEAITQDEVTLLNVQLRSRTRLRMSNAVWAAPPPTPKPSSYTASRILEGPAASEAADPRRGPIPKRLE
jgi:hypothetical protein